MDRIGRGNRRDMGREPGAGIEHGNRARDLTASRLIAASAVALLAAFGEGATLAHAQSYPPESPPRIYHPRPLVKFGGLDDCTVGSATVPFAKAAWYAAGGAGSDHLGVLAVNIHGEIVGTYLVGAEFCLPGATLADSESTLAVNDALAYALAAFGFESVDAFRAAAVNLDEAQLEFTCHAMHCFMQSHSGNPQ